jgi:XTP/dITP diphosphohydrolase
MPLITLDSPLYLASRNPGKLREFRDAAASRGIRLESVPGIEDIPDCLEDGATFEENARKKALHYSAYVSGPVFADDSGISVDALAGAPGVFSARFAGAQATDEENNRKLIEELRRVEEELRRSHLIIEHFYPMEGNGNARTATYQPLHRTAHYVCIIALAQTGQVLCVTEGRADGVILNEPRGRGGFGYDPYFFFPPSGKTFAELSPEEKFAVSHRGEAFRKLLDVLGSRPSGS